MHWEQAGLSGDEGGPRDVPAPSFSQLARQTHLLHETSQLHTAVSSKPLRVLVVGGSMAGSCAAIALHHAGCAVQVFERSQELRSQGAGLVIQPDMAAFLQRYSVAHLEELCVKSGGRQYIDLSGQVVGGDDQAQLFCAWDVLFRALKQHVPPGAYRPGAKVASVSAGATGGCVQVQLEGGQAHTGDLLVGADGPGSLVRSHFCPRVRSQYAGYVAWRGVAPEGEVPARVLGFLGTKFTVYQGPDFHFLCYLIPGEGGQVAPGSRRVNWVWYWNVPEAELLPLMVDREGVQHRHGVPRGLLREEVAAERRCVAAEVLPAALAELVGATSDIFLQAIHDMLAPALAFEGRVCIMGDAGCILRPHTAAGTTKAAVNAAALAGALQSHSFQLGPALEDYSCSQLDLARYLVGVGVRIGTQSQFPP